MSRRFPKVFCHSILIMILRLTWWSRARVEFGFGGRIVPRSSRM